jgi:hypothetical protein
MTDSSASRRPAFPFLVNRDRNPPGVDSRASLRFENGRLASQVSVSRAPNRARPKPVAAREAEMPYARLSTIGLASAWVAPPLPAVNIWPPMNMPMA